MSKKEKTDYFAPVTSTKGSLYFTLGGMSSSFSSESIHFTYENKIRMKTSFKGNDELLTIFESGNAFNSPLNLDLQSKKGEEIKISNIYYKTPFRNNFNFIIGPKMFGYMGLAGQSSIYNERIAILDGSKYTTSTGNGPGIGISYENKNGFNYSIKLSSNKPTFDDKSKYLTSQIGITNNNFGGTLTGNLNENFNAYGIALYYRPKILPSISASIEQKDSNDGVLKNNWIIGIQSDFDKVTYGFALGTHDDQENITYEAWSKIKKTDKLELIPVFFMKKINSEHEYGFAFNTRFKY